MAAQNSNLTDDYWRTQGYKGSARLHLQHWLFQSTLNYIVHPSIAKASTASNDLRIADLACGNGAWLIEVGDHYPNAQLYGFDIQPVHFPPSHLLPSNIKLIKQDILLGDWSDDLIGSFDLVHIRAFCSVIKNNNISPVLDLVKKLLKPGGYLQWDEEDAGAMVVKAGEGQTVQSCQMLLNILHQGGRQSGTVFDWLRDPEEFFTKADLDEVVVEVKSLKSQHLKAWTEDHLLAWEDVARLLPTEKNAPESPLTRDKYLGLLDQVVKETDAGAVLYPERMLVMVGRKK